MAWSGQVEPSSEVAARATTAGARAHFDSPVRVLVVDDNPVNLAVISALLEWRGMLPLLALDGDEAVALACELHFDLILMDLQMPILDGLGATSAIRRFEADMSRPAVPVIAYSSMSPGAGLLAMHGINGCLSKPCEDQELEDCLVRWCPTYRPTPAPAARGAAHGHSGWQTASRNAGSGHAALR
jgi:CheY-like chemotaxis protein